MPAVFDNLNDNLLCCVDCETTGTDPKKHDVIQIAVVPLDKLLKVNRQYLPFVMELKPKRPENVDPEAMRVNGLKICDITTRGMDPWDGADRFVEWFERLKLPMYKKIMPLACNWPFDREFIIEWLGRKTYEMCFSPIYRDVMAHATFINDCRGWKGDAYPYAKCNLQYLCTTLKIERTAAHDALDDARVTAEVYKELLSRI